MQLRTVGKVLLALALAVPALAATSAPATAAAPEYGSQVRKVGEERAASVSLGAASASGRQTAEVRYPGAAYIKVHFSSLRLAPGDYVTVADATGREVHTYHGVETAGDASRTLHGRPGFAAMSVDGEVAVVTLHASSPRAAAHIDGYWRGYTPAEIIANNPGIESVCSTDARRDVICYQSSHPTEYARSHAVAKLLIGGGGSCTTWRVGNTNRMLTNKHCFSTQTAVQSSEMQFNFQCATCGGNNPGAGTKVSGAQLIKVSAGGSGELDYTLYSVNNFTAIQGFGTLYLETRAPVNGERIYIPGHGDGSPKRLSIYEDTQGGAVCTVRSAAYNSWNMSYSCDTSGGNSGSPVLSANHKVLALHHLGGCPNNQGARAHLIYNEISSLIDNGGTPPGTTVYQDSFETATGWTVNPNGTDLATLGMWERGDPEPTSSGVPLQVGNAFSGTNALITGLLAGASAGANDVDGGVTSVRSPAITLPSTGTLTLSYAWYLAHLTNSSSADFFRVSIVHSGGTTALFTQVGAATDRSGAWGTSSLNISAYAGQSVRIHVEATDASTASLVEAGFDDVKIVQS
ncbi:MAG TPA: trypsin-like peptidase domain-containing protein [Micromonosporaceae bacterium]|nr:trypsin-like peptidase domain-containing protein [Micromonosporaceae bacterium]